MIGAKCLARRAAIAASRQCQKIMNIFIGDLAMEPNHSGQLSTISRFSRSEHIEASEGTAMSLFSGLGHWVSKFIKIKNQRLYWQKKRFYKPFFLSFF